MLTIKYAFLLMNSLTKKMPTNMFMSDF